MNDLKAWLILFIWALPATSQAQGFYEGFGIYTVDSCNFENHCFDILIDTANDNTWQVGVSKKAFFGIGDSTQKSILTDSIHAYPANNLSSFEVLPGFDPYWNWQNIWIAFRHKYELDSLHAWGIIEVSTNNGRSWFNVADEDSIWMQSEDYYSFNLYPSSTDTNGISGFTGTQKDWIETGIQFLFVLPVEPGGGPEDWLDDTLKFRFSLYTDSLADTLAGWIIDDMAVGYIDPGSGLSLPYNVNLKVNPNPASSKIRIPVPANSGLIQYSVHSIDGKAWQKAVSFSDQKFLNLNIENLPPGPYFIRLISVDNEWSGIARVMISR